MTRRDLDLVAGAGALLATLTLVAYLAIMRQQGDGPVAWAVAVLVIGAAAAAYGAVRASPYRRSSLLLAGGLLGVLGLLAILSIGLPIIVAGGLCLVAALRHSTAPTT